MKVLEKLSDILKASLKRIQFNDVMARQGRFAAGLIQKRTRLGYGVAFREGDKERLDGLSERYQKTRLRGKQKLTAFGAKKTKRNLSRRRFNVKTLSPKTNPKKSNLTYTGTFLDSLRGAAVRPGEFKVYMLDNRRDGVSNNDLIRWHEERRPFFHISRLEKKQIAKKIRGEYDRAIKTALKKAIG